MDYKILSEYNKSMDTARRALQAEVYQLMLQGWKPQGGVSLTTEKHGYEVSYTFCQAMIKE